MERPTSIHTGLRVLALAGLMSVAAVAQQERQADKNAKPLSGSYYASCLLRIDSRGSLSLDEKTVSALLSSAGVLNAAVSEVLPVPPARVDDVVFVQFKRLPGESSSGAAPGKLFRVPADGGPLIGLVELEILEKNGIEPAAEKLLASLCKRLAAAVESMGEVDYRQLMREADAADHEVDRARDRVEELLRVQRQLWEAAAAADLPRAGILDTIEHYEGEVQSIEYNLVGLKARAAAITEQIAKIAKQMQAAPGADPVAAELEKVVAIREKELEFTRGQQAAEVVSEREVGQAIENLALAKAELAKQRQAVSRAAGGELLAELNKDLVKLSIETAELEARRQFLQAKLSAIKEGNLLELADRYEREVVGQLPNVQRAVQTARERHDALQKTLHTFDQPMVTVIGGK